MAKKLLKGYIPLGAPLNWEACPENEAPVRTVIGFTTNWFHQRAGVDFSEKFHKDPEYRFQSVLAMKKHVRETFPEIGYFSAHDQDGFEQECATISNVYGVCLVAMLYGLKPVYFPHIWPSMRPEDHLTAEQVKNLKPFDLKNHPIVEQLFEQMDFIQSKWGKIDGYINYQGVLNNAFKIRGSEIFMDMIDDPGMCRFLFEHITDTMINLAKMVQRRQRESGFQADCFGTSNCVVNMVSPEDYREQVLPFDRKIAEAFPAFGIHSCNWVLDPYVKEFSSIEKLGYIDFGSKSNLELVREYFPDARRMVFYDPDFLVSKSEEEVGKDIARMYQILGPCDICLPDVDLQIPDEKVRLFDRLVQGMLKSE